jgi:hypothetical protein
MTPLVAVVIYCVLRVVATATDNAEWHSYLHKLNGVQVGDKGRYLAACMGLYDSGLCDTFMVIAITHSHSITTPGCSFWASSGMGLKVSKTLTLNPSNAKRQVDNQRLSALLSPLIGHYQFNISEVQGMGGAPYYVLDSYI